MPRRWITSTRSDVYDDTERKRRKLDTSLRIIGIYKTVDNVYTIQRIQYAQKKTQRVSCDVL